MKQKSLLNNIKYSIFTQMVCLITPLITAPYIARVFNAELIGDYSYVYANSSYFVLLESLGLVLYGTIKIAKIRDNIIEKSILFWEIFWLKCILMILSSVLYCVFFISLGEKNLEQLYFLMLMNIFANGIDTVWFLNALEEFKVTAIRTVVIRLVNVILIICFVNDVSDLLRYALITQATLLFSSIILLPLSFKQVVWIPIEELNMLKHISKSMSYLVPGLVNIIFSSADKSILGGFSKITYEVGVYEQANKVSQMGIGLISSISNVILPRSAYLFANVKKQDSANSFMMKTVNGAAFVSCSFVFEIFATANQFIPAFFGDGYEKSVIILQILCINVLTAVMGNFIAHQCLIARNKQTEYNIAILIGATVNLILNVVLVNRYLSEGVAASSAFSGGIVLGLILFYTNDILPLKNFAKMIWKYLFAGFFMIASVCMLSVDCNIWLSLLGKTFLGFIVYIICLIFLRDNFVMEVISRVKR